MPVPQRPAPPRVLIAVAPNGARRTKADHGALPMTADEIAREAAAAAEAGAAMVHLHVRDTEGRHVLDAERYRAAIAAVRAATGGRMVVQITTEAVGRYAPDAQMAVVFDVRPEAVSLALRELCPDEAAETRFADFLGALLREHIAPQFILYDAADVTRLLALAARGVVPEPRPSVLFALGRYAAGQTSAPSDLLPFLAAAEGRLPRFMVAAFGRREAACGAAAALLGGDIRVGFENNLLLPSGAVAPNNAALVAAVRDPLAALGIALKSADDIRAEFAGTFA